MAVEVPDLNILLYTGKKVCKVCNLNKINGGDTCYFCDQNVINEKKGGRQNEGE